MPVRSTYVVVASAYVKVVLTGPFTVTWSPEPEPETVFPSRVTPSAAGSVTRVTLDDLVDGPVTSYWIRSLLASQGVRVVSAASQSLISGVRSAVSSPDEAYSKSVTSAPGSTIRARRPAAS